MGPLEQILGMLPGMGNLKELAAEPRAGRRQAARARRGDHQLDDAGGAAQSPASSTAAAASGSRKGSGTSVEEVNRLLKQFVQMQKMLKQLGGMAGLGQEEAAASG